MVSIEILCVQILAEFCANLDKGGHKSEIWNGTVPKVFKTEPMKFDYVMRDNASVHCVRCQSYVMFCNVLCSCLVSRYFSGRSLNLHCKIN